MNKYRISSGKISGLLSGMGIFIYCSLTSSVSAFADSSLSDTITSPIKGGLGEVYKLLTSIILPIAVIVLAINAIKIIWGNQKTAEEGKSAIVRIVIAIGLIYLAPLLISTISGWFSSYSDQGGIFT